MRSGTIILLMVLMLPALTTGAGDWRADLDQALTMEPGGERDEMVASIASALAACWCILIW